MTGSRRMFSGFLSTSRSPAASFTFFATRSQYSRAHAVQSIARHVAQLLRIVGACRHEIVERVLHEALLVHRLELRMRVERELQQRGARPRKAHDEHRALGGGRRAGVIPRGDIRGVAAPRR